MLDTENMDVPVEKSNSSADQEDYVLSDRRQGLTANYFVYYQAWNDFLNCHKEKMTDIILTTFNKAGVCLGDNIDNNVSLTFVDDHKIRQINHEWRNKDKPTNVLSFPIFDQEELRAQAYLNNPCNEFGDIIIAWQYCQNEAKNANISFEDHIFHMVIHGILHILGYDHIQLQEALIMEALEVQILSEYGMQNPYV